jgi:hypothetical protein
MPPKRRDNSDQAPTSRRTTRAALSAAQQADEPHTIVSSEVANTTLPVSQTNIEETIRSTLNSLLPSILPSILAESNRNTASLNNNDKINNAPQITVPQTSSPQITAPQIHVELPSAPSITLRPFNGNGDIVEFLNEFKSASIIYKWSPERQLELMNAYLTEGASEFYKSMSPLEKLNIEMVYKN